jgi:uncharacterized phage protein (TIGR01671 family)
MKKEIKFRAWDGFQKKMFDIKSLKLPHREDLSPEVCLMQFTGLHDKNGKEIYEGDIIEYTIFDYEGNDTQKVGQVNIGEGDFSWWCGDNYLAVVSKDDEREVIGNIYENPELLN